MQARLMREARQLIWPWCIVCIAGLYSLMRFRAGAHGWRLTNFEQFLLPLGIFIGVPLLASLPIGYEFQWHTLTLALSQPIQRSRVWRDKQYAILLAAVPAGLIYALAGRAAKHFDTTAWPFALAWMSAIIAGATLWTLIARSTMGGLVLNIGANTLLFSGASYLQWKFSDNPSASEIFAVARGIGFVGYVGFLVWSGYRVFTRYQLVEGSRGEDALTRAASQVVPQSISDAFVCRPQSPLTNLLRKELKMLRPIWPLTVISIMAWTAVMSLAAARPEQGREPNPTTNAMIMLSAIAAVMTPLIAVLSGALSLGEEKIGGTHDWHMTLPVSQPVQWVCKLGTAIIVAAFAGGLTPILIPLVAGILKGTPLRFVENEGLWIVPLMCAVLAISAFWSATVVKGTLRAILVIFPFFFVLALIGEAAAWSAENVLPMMAGVQDGIVNSLDPFRLARFIDVSRLFNRSIFFWFVPAICLMLVQSYRQFRGRTQDTTKHLLLATLPLCATVFFCSFALWATATIVLRAEKMKENLFHELHAAIEQVQSTRGEDPTIRVTSADLAKAAPMSEATQRWISGGTITISKQLQREVGWCCGLSYGISAKPGAKSDPYVAAIPLKNGTTCTVTFQARKNSYGILAGYCR